jgi:cyanoexosortase A
LIGIELDKKLDFLDRRFWLLTIAGLLIAFNLCLVGYSSIYLLFWCAALLITWRSRNQLDFEGDLTSSLLGLGLISWLLFRGVISKDQLDVITRMYPIFSVMAIYLVASKASQLKQYWREILVVSLTGIPWEHISSLVLPMAKVSILDAQISRFMLWYVGFEVVQQDNLVILPQGAIQIAGACSSFGLLGLMWQCCLVICFYFALKRNQQLLLWIYSSLIALGVNGVRLCLMAILVANNRTAAFDYWHGSAGGEIFTTAAILILAGVCWLLIPNHQEVLPNT